MPVYIFECPECKKRVELIQPFSAPPPSCECRGIGRKMVKQWATTGPVFLAVITRSYRSPQGFKITTQDQD
jgi:putative FmdB family regulatory protein